MMSGPAPVLAATAAFGRTSSQPSLSTRTSMPYLSWNFATFFMYWSMSPCTKRLHRSTRSFAPFSGALFHCALASLTQISGPIAAPAARPADVCRNLRRLDSLTFLSSLLWCDYERSSGAKRHSAGGVEQMRTCGIRVQAHAIAGPAAHTVARKRCKLLPIETAVELRVRAGRLDDDDVGGEPRAFGQPAMFGPHAIEYRLSVRRAGADRRGERHAAGEFDDRAVAFYAR